MESVVHRLHTNKMNDEGQADVEEIILRAVIENSRAATLLKSM